MTPPAIGSAWHNQHGQNLFVTDIVWRGDHVVVKFTTENGVHRENVLSEFATLYSRGYVL